MQLDNTKLTNYGLHFARVILAITLFGSMTWSVTETPNGINSRQGHIQVIMCAEYQQTHENTEKRLI